MFTSGCCCQTFEHLLISSLPIAGVSSLWILSENPVQYIWVFPPNAILGLNHCYDYAYFCFSIQKFHLRGMWPPAHVTAMTSMRTSCSYWLLCFIQSDKGVRLDAPNLCKGHLTGQRSMWGTTFALHPFLSNTLFINPHPTACNPTKAGVWTFSNSLTPSSHKAIKL